MRAKKGASDPDSAASFEGLMLTIVDYFGLDGWHSQQKFLSSSFCFTFLALEIYPNSASAKMHVEGPNKLRV
jgi:hypothetical protein